MMKAKKMSKKLFLKKETVATLSPVELNSAKGGFTGIGCTALDCANVTNQSCTPTSGVFDNYSMNCL